MLWFGVCDLGGFAVVDWIGCLFLIIAFSGWVALVVVCVDCCFGGLLVFVVCYGVVWCLALCWRCGYFLAFRLVDGGLPFLFGF